MIRNLVFLFSFILLAAFTRTPSNQMKEISWFHSVENGGETLVFSHKAKKGLKKTIYTADDHSIMTGLAQVISYKRSQYFLLTYWNLGQGGYIKVFNPTMQSDPVCEVSTESDFLKYRFKGKILQVQTVFEDRKVWDDCYTVRAVKTPSTKRKVF